MHAIYVRVSTEDQAQRGYSIPSQLEACRTRLPAGEEVWEFIDDGRSGSTLERPALERLRQQVRESPDPVHVITYDPDRLSRNLVHLLLLAEEFGRGGSLTFVSMAWEASPEGRLFLSLRGAVAEFEREKIRERTTRGRLQKARQGGIACVPQHLYGYHWNPDTGQLTVREEEAEVVGDIFRLYLEGLGAAAIARSLNGRGLVTSKGNAWRPATVSRMLKNGAYRGILWQFRQSQSPIPTEIPAIIDDLTWEQAQAIRQRRLRTPTAGTSRRSLLGGLLDCGTCGAPMYTSHRREGRSWYICRRKAASASFPESGPCPSRNHPVDRLDAEVWREVAQRIGAPGTDWGPQANAGEGGTARSRERIRSERDRIGAGRKRLLGLLARGVADAEEVEAQLGAARLRLAALDAEERELDRSPAFADDAFVTWAVERIGEIHREVYADSSLPLETRRRLVRALLERVEVRDDGAVTVRFR